MIASLNGVITMKTPTVLIVEVHGVGYQVLTPLSTFYRLPEEKSKVSLHIHTHVREDALLLFGFLTPREKAVFLLLLGVSSVGPKLALNILSGIELNELIHAIREEQVHRLKAIPGVGPKMAGRLILELKEKVAQMDLAGTDSLQSVSGGEDSNQNDALSALINLGYARMDAKRAIEQIFKEAEGASVEDLIREGLKRLAKVR